MAMGLGSILNTLAGLDPRTLAEAAEEEERQRLAASTSSAAAAAQQAQGAYQQAAAEPPIPSGLAEFFPALLANVASTIGQEPAYREQEQERQKESRATSLRLRAENLQALRDVWGQKADAAKNAGDIEAEATARQKRESIARTWEVVNQNAENAAKREEAAERQKGALELERERQRGDIATERERGAQQRQTLTAEGGRADRAAREASTRQGLDPDTGFVLRTFYQKEANKLRISARQARGGDQKAAITSGIIENEIQRIAGESAMDFYLRLKSVTHPFERERKGKQKVPKALFTPEDVVQALQTNLTPEEFAALKTRIQARAR